MTTQPTPQPAGDAAIAQAFREMADAGGTFKQVYTSIMERAQKIETARAIQAGKGVMIDDAMVERAHHAYWNFDHGNNRLDDSKIDRDSMRAALKAAFDEVVDDGVEQNWRREEGIAALAGSQGEGDAALRKPLPVPTDIMEARAQGRSEALAIILGLEAETGLDEFISSAPAGDSGEYNSYWNENKLSELFRTDDAAWSLMQQAEGEYWHNLGLREEAEYQARVRTGTMTDADQWHIPATNLPAPAAPDGDGSRESRMVVVKRDESGTPTVWCDPEIVDLVTALNAGGIPTVASCSGHGEKHGNIALRDGRELLIAANFEAAREMDTALSNPRVGEAVAWSVLQVGNYGAAYDSPGTKRAYTYDHQPGNIDASKLGRATDIAAVASAGDSIDRGLSLLKTLQEEGFGVFQIGQPQSITTPPTAIPDGMVVESARYRWLRKHRSTNLIISFFGGGCINKEMEDVEAEIDKQIAAAPGSSDEERCESGDPECGPVEFHDSEGVPLCRVCWEGLCADAAPGSAEGE